MSRHLAYLVGCLCLLAVEIGSTVVAAPPDGNRLASLDEVDPYCPHRDFPKLVTPQWVGEPGVDAVVVLAIDDMRDPARYEAYLRPILNRLKRIDGRAPVSIMTNQVDPNDPRLQAFLKEGLSLECHTLTHPCPLLAKGDFAAAARDYHGCVDLMNKIPGNAPVAFRMPCCDSMNSVGPRFFAELFNKTSPGGKFLAIDSSVFTVLTPDDPALPRNLVFGPDGKERFRKYIPFPSFVNTIENYPYPYVIGKLCWEFPCIVPSDWEAQNLQKPNNPKTLEDLKAALDCVVLKQGVFNFVFHPHGWIKPEQVVELIDHAVQTHGKKVKFLTFKEALERLNTNLLGGHGLRSDRGQDNGFRLVDQNRDGRVEAVRDEGTDAAHEFQGLSLPPGARLRDDQGRDAGLRFVDLDEDGQLDVVFSNDREYGVYLFESMDKGWTRKVMAGKAGAPGALPKIVRDGANNGFFVHSRHLWWQNEDTAKLPNVVDRRAFNDLLKDVEPRGKGPAAALKSVRVAPGFTVEAVATEPLVKDPIAFEWGADGKLWVVEMGDYPLGVDGKGKHGGVVRFLEDANGDGRYDQATTFLEGLGFPTGVMPWRKGVLVSCAPDIFYAEDRDGDGKADHKEVLFTGFVEGNQQHRLNGFELGLDGWVYGANGDSGGTVRSRKTGKVVAISGRDFRFRPDTGEFEAESGQTQYGRHRDDWGHWFGNDNPNWGWHFVLSDPDLRRNPHYAAPDPKQTLEPDTRLFPISRTLARFNEPGSANHVTSANSPTPYRDELFGPWFATSLFVSEPVHNLVHRMVLEPDGATFRGRGGPTGSGRAGGGTGGHRVRAASSWPRATTGSGRRCSRPGRTELSGSPTCIVKSSSIPNGSPTIGRNGSTSGPVANRGGSIASFPSIRNRGRSLGSMDWTRRGWSPRSTVPAAGSAIPRSGCSCIAAARRRSRLSATWGGRPSGPRHASRRSGRWRTSAGSTNRPRWWG
jgi:putative membrane-bound dehydrogenase-like protein